MRKTSGITLIALVITIIVLLILAGVSISAITGENGIVDKAKEAAEETEAAQKEEEDILAGYEEELEDALKDTSGLNEYGFYYDKLYEGTVVENGETMGLAYLFHEDGSVEVFINQEGLKDYLICVYSGTYEEFASDIVVSDDGLAMTITIEGTEFILTCDEMANLHGIYWGDKYSTTETIIDETTGVTTVRDIVAILNENGTGTLTVTVTTDGIESEPTVTALSNLTVDGNGYFISGDTGGVLVSTDGVALVIEIIDVINEILLERE